MDKIANEPSATRIVYDIDRCLYQLRRCVRLSPDGTVKPEGEIKMTHDEFYQWVRDTKLQSKDKDALNRRTDN